MRGVPWHVKGLDPAALDAARDAARRAGMSVGEWLNSVIADQAPPPPPTARQDLRRRRHDDAPSHAHAHNHEHDRRDDDRHDHHGSYQNPYGDRRERRAEHHRPGNGPDVSTINDRLDNLTAQLDALAQRDAARMPDRTAQDRDLHLADAIARLGDRLDRVAEQRTAPAPDASWPSAQPGHADVGAALSRLSDSRFRASYGGEPLPTPPPPARAPASPVDQAVEEIAARQRALDGDDPGPPPHAARLAASPQPFGITEVVGALRQDLGDIVRSVQEAMPRRAIEALEQEVRAISGRLDAGRAADNGDGQALSALDRGLADVRETLRGLAPAESLSGVGDAVRVLSQKVDKIAASGADPVALQQLETAIAGLRNLVGHVASGDALTGLATEVRGLADKFDQNRQQPAAMQESLAKLEARLAGIADHVERGQHSQGNDVLAVLERRVAGIADTLETRKSEPGLNASPEIQSLVKALSDKLENLQLGKGDHVVLGHLEERITKLVEKLDASESKLGHIGAIERGMAELLVHLEDLRRSNPNRTARPVSDGSATDLERQVAALKQSERSTKESVEQAHSTIDQVVDRIASIETDLRSSAPAAVVRQVIGAPSAGERKPPPRVSPQSPTMMPAEAKPAAASPPPQPAPDAKRRRQPVDPNLPADAPLEPGSGAPRVRVIASAADRIAASETALGGARTAPKNPAGAVQAARRAAKAAASGQGAGPAPKTAEPAEEAPARTLRSRFKTLLVGASVIALIAGGLRLAIDYLDSVQTSDGVTAPGAPAATAPKPSMPRTSMPNASVLIPDSDSLLAPTSLPPTPGGGPPAANPAAAMPGPKADARPQDVKPDARPFDKSADARTPDPEATGSIPVRAPTPPQKSIYGDPLPSVLGGSQLLQAALAGDVAAAYEVGVRYADGRPGLPANPESAALWLDRAAKGSVTPAQFRLGSLYEKGIGVRKDLNEARKLYRLAADKGHAKAMHNLAVLYAEGIDGRPDYAAAVSWFRKAAAYGVVDSEYNLAILYVRGIGVDRNMIEAFKWFALAAQGGDQDAAKKRDDVGARLDPGALATAQQAVSGFVAETQPEGAATVKAPPGGWDQEARARPRARVSAKPATP